jgi:hypothetical protein
VSMSSLKLFLASPPSHSRGFISRQLFCFNLNIFFFFLFLLVSLLPCFIILPCYVA